MRIAFRADASLAIGTGHVMRCLTLAQSLRDAGAQCMFLCRDLPGAMIGTILDAGHICHVLPAVSAGQGDLPHSHWLPASQDSDAADCAAALGSQDLTALIVDHYALDARWQQQMRHITRRIMVIDDLADRPHDCDLLLDQNHFPAGATRYDGLIPSDCLRLLGPRFALLRPEFAALRPQAQIRNQGLRTLLIAFGGVDAPNQTAVALEGLALLTEPPAVHVVIGATNPHQHSLDRLIDSNGNATLHVATPHMGTLMLSSDLALGAAGTSSWERCCLGLPTLAVSIADNQTPILAGLVALGVARSLGMGAQLTAVDWSRAISALREDRAALAAMSRCAMACVDGSGASYVAQAILA
jgi:UDP-2,4-diacetamido-2,4,6-trideoxy-beta-L-altropyranose hydrolase